MPYERVPGICGWAHPWTGRRKSAECVACLEFGLVAERYVPRGHVPGQPYPKTLAKFEDYAFLRNDGVDHEDALRRVGWKQNAFERACYRWPEWAPEVRS